MQKGAVLVTLEDFEQKNSLENSRQVLSKAQLELEDVLIGLRVRCKDTIKKLKEVL